MSVQCSGSGFVQRRHKVIHWYMFDVDRAVCGRVTLRPTLVPVFAPASPPIVLKASLSSLTKLDAPGNPKTDQVTEHIQLDSTCIRSYTRMSRFILQCLNNERECFRGSSSGPRKISSAFFI